MLAMADEHGIVNASVDGLARRAVVPIEDCEAALSTFMEPDRFSRDGTSGERIETVPGGWLVLNHAQYRDKRTAAQIATAARVKRHRERTKAVTANKVTADNAKAPSEAEADTEKKKSAHFDAFWSVYPRKVGKGAARKAYAKVVDGKPNAHHELYQTVQLYRTATDGWKPEDRKFIPYPATWLNQERYHDNPSEWVDAKAGPTRTEIEERNLEAAGRRSANHLAESQAITAEASTAEAETLRQEAIAEFRRKAKA